MPEEIQFLKDGVIEMGNAQRQWDIGDRSVKYLVAMNQNHTYPKVHETGARLFMKDDLVKGLESSPNSSSVHRRSLRSFLRGRKRRRGAHRCGEETCNRKTSSS